jgi:hypothetical protein
MLSRVPRDVVICNWQYAPDASPDTTQTLLDAGFDVMLCSALNRHDQTLFPGERSAMPNVRVLDTHRQLSGRGRVLGHLVTIWTPVRYVADSLWPAIDLAAATLRDGASVDADATLRRFAETFHGLTGDAAARFAEVVRLLLDESPPRGEWLPIVRLTALLPATRDRVEAVAPRWARAAAILGELDACVAAHSVEFRAFALVIDILAHAYDTAVRVADPLIAPAEIEKLVARGAAIVDRVDRAWDRERFADDARKHTAPIPSFQNDHLLPLLAAGLTALRGRAADARQAAEVRSARRSHTMAATSSSVPRPLAN